jgi:hypothetical protein
MTTAASPYPGGVVGTPDTVSVAGPPGAPWGAANITFETLQNATTGAQTNVVDVFFFLATGNVPNGSVQVDYTQNNDGSLTLDDQFFRQANGAETAVFFGSEATNPLLTSVPTSSSQAVAGYFFQPSNPGYAYTSYSYAADGALTQVVAQSSTGQIYVGT